MPRVAVGLPVIAGQTSAFTPATNGGVPVAIPRRTEKVYFISESGDVIRVPFAPSEMSVEKLAPVYSTIERPGRQELLVYDRNQLPQVTLTAFIAAEDQVNNHLGSVEWWITNFRHHILAKKRWRFTYGDQVNRHWWRFTDVSLSSQLRSPYDNSIVVATMDIQLTQASDISIRTGPVTGGLVPSTPPPSGGTTTRQTYIVTSESDTLWNIAIRFLGAGERWTEIAALNKITDPRTLTVGQRLKIPDPNQITIPVVSNNVYLYSTLTGKPISDVTYVQTAVLNSLTTQQINSLYGAGLLQ